jgi:chromate reductase
MPRTIAVLVGSLRKESWNRKIIDALIAEAPGGLEFRIVEIGDLPHFNQDIEATPPPQWARFRDELKRADAVLFATPEYNRSVPGALKNAIDVGSRPYGHSVFNGKPAAVISASVAAPGGFGANHHLRQSLVFLNMPTLAQPEAYIGNVQTLFEEGGALKQDSRQFLAKFANSFAAWIEKHVAPS